MIAPRFLRRLADARVRDIVFAQDAGEDLQ